MTINPTKETLSITKDSLRKAVTLSNGLSWYDLRPTSVNIYPVVTPLRNAIPRVQRPNPGDAARWKQVTALTGSGYDSLGWVPEGQRSGIMNATVASKSASYITIGEEDYVTFEAEAAASEDIGSVVTNRLLHKLMRKEEIGLLAGNASLALGTPSAPTLAASGSGATLPAATYSVIVVALTLEGWKNATLAGGVATSQVITGADGRTFTLKGGSSNKSSNATQAVTLGQTLSATATAVNGAIAYAWYVGTAGSETLQAITTINSATFSAALAGSRQQAGDQRCYR